VDAVAVSVADEADLAGLAGVLGVGGGGGCIVVVGGAAGMTEDEVARAESAFMHGLIPLAERRRTTVLDGGTDVGVMRLTGRSRAHLRGTFPLVGVVVAALVEAADEGAEASLEPNHSHFILVPGSDWGEEAPWLSRVASALAPDGHAVTVLVNGGDVAWQDVELSVRAGRPILVVEGTGRTADKLAAAVRGASSDPRAAAIAAEGAVFAGAVDDPAGIARLADKLLGEAR
jgi:hypothetical protein